MSMLRFQIKLNKTGIVICIRDDEGTFVLAQTLSLSLSLSLSCVLCCRGRSSGLIPRLTTAK